MLGNNVAHLYTNFEIYLNTFFLINFLEQEGSLNLTARDSVKEVTKLS